MGSSTGKTGEEKAVLFLKKLKYKILATNYHSRFGEIDIVAREDKQIVFVEVKARSSSQFGTPAEAINYFKLQKMIKTAHIFLKVHNLKNVPFRFDAVEVRLGEKTEFTHIKNITL